MREQRTSKSVQGIKEAVKLLAPPNPERILACVVVAVDPTEYTVDCDPINGKASLTEIKLRPEGQSAIVSFPAVGQVVVVGLINGSDGYVIQATATTAEILGNADTAVRFSELETAFNELKSEYDDLVGVVNSIVTTLQTWVVVPSDGGAALKVAAAGLSSGGTSTADISGAEVPEVKIGN